LSRVKKEETVRPRNLRRLGVVGAGNMGSGIAQKMASEGFPVVLVDVDGPSVERGMRRIEATLDEAVQRRIFRPEQAEEIRRRIKAKTDLHAVANCDLVVEAVFEDLQVKQKVLRELDRLCRPRTVLATNTSSFSVTELARTTRRPGHVLGLHYFYHPAKNRLVEVVPGEVTSEETRLAAWRLQELLGKTPIHSEDAPGFIVNRYFVPWLNESVRMLEEEAGDIPTIEAAARETFGIGMGPFELMNVTGVPIAFHSATTLGEKLGPFYAPAPALRRQVEAARPWDLRGEASAERRGLGERLLGVVFLVAGQLLDEGVCSLEDCDIGARVGLRWTRGPFELMNRLGISEAIRLARAIAERAGLELPESLAEQEAARAPFPIRLVKTEAADGIATITINRPDAMNALNPEVARQLRQAFDAAAGDGQVRAIVLAGSGKTFVAGADVRFFVRQMEKGDLAPIVAFTEACQDLLRRIDRCPKPVIARLDGLSLGGGSELALACHAIVATERGSLGFPETGIGIYPGLGGTQRTPRRVGIGLARYLIFTGEAVSAEEAARIGLVDEVVPAADLPEAIARIAARPRRAPSPPAVLPEPWRKRAAFFAAHRVEALLAGDVDAGGDADIERAIQRVRQKAPLALRLAERLIDEGSAASLEDGLRMELAHLEEIFRTQDALEGLSSLGSRRPAFRGR
jgi:enoyl-CoA hydratase/3-hydroxyacyl-CoA dehydrogenase